MTGFLVVLEPVLELPDWPLTYRDLPASASQVMSFFTFSSTIFPLKLYVIYFIIWKYKKFKDQTSDLVDKRSSIGFLESALGSETPFSSCQELLFLHKEETVMVDGGKKRGKEFNDTDLDISATTSVIIGFV